MNFSPANSQRGCFRGDDRGVGFKSAHPLRASVPEGAGNLSDADKRRITVTRHFLDHGGETEPCLSYQLGPHPAEKLSRIWAPDYRYAVAAGDSAPQIHAATKNLSCGSTRLIL